MNSQKRRRNSPNLPARDRLQWVAEAEIDAPAPRERPPKKRPATKHINPPTRIVSPSVLKALHELMENPRRRGPWPPLASPAFLQRATIRLKTIGRRSDGQLMLAALLRGEAEGGPPRDGSSALWPSLLKAAAHSCGPRAIPALA